MNAMNIFNTSQYQDIFNYCHNSKDSTFHTTLSKNITSKPQSPHLSNGDNNNNL